MPLKPRTPSDSHQVSRLDHKIRISDERLMRGSVRHKLAARLFKWFDADSSDAFVMLPAQKAMHTPYHWRIELRGLSPSAPLRMEIAGDVVMGIERGGAAPDLDLAPYDGFNKGVSRIHAMFRPSKNRLYLIDLSSSNGTRINTLPVHPITAAAIHDQDVISLGALSFSVAILNAPYR